MRHQVKNNRLNVFSSHSKSILANLSASIILYEKVKTTEGRAKKVRSVLEKLITMAKGNSPMNAMRKLNAFLPDANASKKLMEELLKRYAQRHSGYVRIVPLGFRAGDAARMVQIELV